MEHKTPLCIQYHKTRRCWRRGQAKTREYVTFALYTMKNSERPNMKRNREL